MLITDGDKDSFRMVAIQTDDALILAIASSAAKEKEEIEKAKFRTKPKTSLSPESTLEFNGCTLTMEGQTLGLRSKGQGQKLDCIDLKAPDRAQRYLEQRASGAYLASLCQPEAAFDLSVAAQAQDAEDEDYKRLNERVKWQMQNVQRGLHFVPVNMSSANLMVFTNGSFANNRDFSSQLGHLIYW